MDTTQVEVRDEGEDGDNKPRVDSYDMGRLKVQVRKRKPTKGKKNSDAAETNAANNVTAGGLFTIELPEEVSKLANRISRRPLDISFIDLSNPTSSARNNLLPKVSKKMLTHEKGAFLVTRQSIEQSRYKKDGSSMNG